MQSDPKPIVFDAKVHFVLAKHGIFPLIIALSVMSSVMLSVGAIVIIILNEGYFNVNHEKVLYLSDGECGTPFFPCKLETLVFDLYSVHGRG